jgi:hypothetical protein
MSKKSEQQLAEEWVAYVSRGLEILHPLSRQALLDYLQKQVVALNSDMELDRILQDITR